MSNVRYVFDKSTQLPVFNPQLEYIDYSKFEHDWNSQIHSHSFMELALAVGGSGSLLIEGQTFPVETGNLIVIPPNKAHTEVSSENDALEYYILGVKNMTLKEQFPEGVDIDDIPFRPVIPLGGLDATVKTVFTDIFSEMKTQRRGYEIMVQSHLLRLSALLMRLTDLKASFNIPEEMKRGCAMVKEYIDAHYSDKITLEELCQLSCISKFHLIHEFSKYVGKSPIAYQLKCRIREAKYLLTSTDSSIADISYALGFSSISHFSQRFKIEEGCTPLEFRKKSYKK